MIKDELNFVDTFNFAVHLFGRVYNNKGLIVSVVARFEDMKEIVKAIMFDSEDIDFEKINMVSPIINGYEDEYILDMFIDDDDSIFFNVEPAKQNGKYTDLSNDEVYIFDDCSSKTIDACKHSDTYIVHIGEDDEFEGEAEEECSCSGCKKNRALSNVDKTEYRVNGKEVSEKEYNKVENECDELLEDIKNYHRKFVNNEIKSWLKDYCKTMEEFNNLFARMW